MSEPFVGEIQMFAGNFPPRGWAFCNGQTLSIAQYSTLFTILGTTYGGDGQTTFKLPNLVDRVPLQQGQGPGLAPRTLGEIGGVTNVTLTPQQMPAHTHTIGAHDGTAAVKAAAGNVWAKTSGGRKPPAVYSNQAPTVAMNPAALTPVGGSQPHNNMQPVLGINFIIALEGTYPTRD